ncbi:MAG: hypothetical protein KGJ60_11200 [Verrucomicrobiota bacterium]|nr:hypothetical protein [Verrucomicrobiota bacterium]
MAPQVLIERRRRFAVRNTAGFLRVMDVAKAGLHHQVVVAIALIVKWIERTDQPETRPRIRFLGGASGRCEWKHTYAQAIEFIERGVFSYFVETNGRFLKLESGRTEQGRKCLTVQTEGGPSQILLDLPEFPAPMRVNFAASPDGSRPQRRQSKAEPPGSA